jgi:hydrogenase maturation protease
MNGILVAGIGNIFQGDDAFGVVVAQRLASRKLPPDVKVVDFGTRGIDLAYALMEGYDTVILVDAAARGEPAGTLSLIEPELPSVSAGETLLPSAHDLDPHTVLQLVQELGGARGRVLLVVCEPLDCGGDEGCMGLSAPVTAAIEPAVDMIVSLLVDLRASEMNAA